MAEEVCFPVAHRQVVLTIPKRLRLHARFDRKLLGKLAACAWRCVRDEVRGQLGGERRPARDGRGGPDPRRTVALAPAHPRPGHLRGVHPGGPVPRSAASWTRSGCGRPGGKRCFALYLAEGKIDAAAVENMRGWPHSGFGADPSPPLAAGDRAGIERVTQYITRCPLSLARLVEGDATRAGDLPGGEGRPAGRFPIPRRGAGGGDEAEFSGAAGVGVSRRVHATHSAARART